MLLGDPTTNAPCRILRVTGLASVPSFLVSMQMDCAVLLFGQMFPFPIASGAAGFERGTKLLF